MIKRDYPARIYTWMKVGSRSVKFQVDSGASCDVVRLEDLSERHLQTVTETTEVVRLYNNSSLHPQGRCWITLSNPKTGDEQKVNALVMRGAPVSIIGACTSQAMGLLSIHFEKIWDGTNAASRLSSEVLLALSESKAMKATLVNQYQSVFEGELGTFSGSVHLAVDPAILPVKIPLRRVPVALQDKLTEGLERLQQLGIITRIEEPTDWVSALVVTEKKSGAIRVCLDPAHLNKALKRNDYPLPTMEDILPRLSRAKVFTVCDVRHGYWHVQLDEESSLLTTFNTPQGRF